MSCGAPLPGGVGQARAPTKEDQEILDKVKDAYEKQSGTKPSKFRAILVGIQVVAGQNYFFKVETGANVYSHVKVFVALPHENAGPSLVAIQQNKTKEEKLSYF
ncbi:cystatin-A-like [Lithobates pipiens]